jgi:acyl-CoA-binding protein
MDLKEKFENASEEVMNLEERPSNDELLALYAYYKQGTEGDVSGKRPGMMNLKGRAKYDAWAKLEGMSSDEAMGKYIELVETLSGK